MPRHNHMNDSSDSFCESLKPLNVHRWIVRYSFPLHRHVVSRWMDGWQKKTEIIQQSVNNR